MTRAAAHAVLLLVCSLALFPLLWALVTSFKPPNDVHSLALVSAEPTLDNYAEVFRAIPFLSMLTSTLAVSVLVAFGTVALSTAVAYALARWEFPGKNLLFLAFAGSLLIPFQVTMIPNYLLVARLGWLNSLPGLVIPQLGSSIGVGLGVLFLRQHFRGFPTALFDAAEMDGAGPFRTLWSVVLPNMRAPLSALAILVFLHAWNEYFWPLLVTKNLETTMIQVGLQLFLQSEGNAWGPLMAAAIMAALPVFLIYLLAQRQITDAFVRSGMR